MAGTFADALPTPPPEPPPPTFVVDSLILHFPFDMIVGLALAASAIVGFFWLRRAFGSGSKAAVLCLFLYAMANFGVYLLAAEAMSEARQRVIEENQKPRPPRTNRLPARTEPSPAPPTTSSEP